MQLQNQEQNEKLQTLISAAEAATAVFIQHQEKAESISENIERNKKMIEALEAENEELKRKSEKVTVSETGEVNFSEFDDFSDQITANQRKINVLKEIIKRFEIELEIFILSDYKAAYNHSDMKINETLGFYAENMLKELFNENTMQRINTALSLFRMSGKGLAVSEQTILDHVRSKLDKTFSANVEGITLPKKLFRNQNEYNIILSQRRVAELRRELIELN